MLKKGVSSKNKYLPQWNLLEKVIKLFENTRLKCRNEIE
jgi:hypothetical protein